MYVYSTSLIGSVASDPTNLIAKQLVYEPNAAESAFSHASSSTWNKLLKRSVRQCWVGDVLNCYIADVCIFCRIRSDQWPDVGLNVCDVLSVCLQVLILLNCRAHRHAASKNEPLCRTVWFFVQLVKIRK